MSASPVLDLPVMDLFPDDVASDISISESKELSDVSMN